MFKTQPFDNLFLYRQLPHIIRNEGSLKKACIAYKNKKETLSDIENEELQHLMSQSDKIESEKHPFFALKLQRFAETATDFNHHLDKTLGGFVGYAVFLLIISGIMSLSFNVIICELTTA
jgi:hypothetical protein